MASILGSVAPHMPNGMELYSYRKPMFRVRLRLILKSSWKKSPTRFCLGSSGCRAHGL